MDYWSSRYEIDKWIKKFDFCNALLIFIANMHGMLLWKTNKLLQSLVRFKNILTKINVNQIRSG